MPARIIAWTIAERLTKLGFMTDAQRQVVGNGLAKEILPTAIQQYQQFHGLKVSGELDGETAAHMFAPRMCQLPDTFHMSATQCRWPTNRITWNIVQDVPGIARDVHVQAVKDALTAWMAVADLDLVYAPGDPTANVLIGSTYIDGPGGVLAQSELPCPPHSPLQQQFDSGEHWDVFPGDKPGVIDLQRVTCHEWGHALGMGHLPANPPQLMSPTYSPAIMGPQAGDIQEMVSRYGPAKSVSVPVPSGVPTPMPTGGFNWAGLIQQLLPLLMQILATFVKNNPQAAAQALTAVSEAMKKANGEEK